MIAPADDLSPKTIIREATVRASAAEVWRLWTTSEGMAEWLVQSSRIELGIGGAFELHFMPEGEPGLRGSEGCRFLFYLPHRLLCFTWNAPPHLKTRDSHTWVVLELERAGDGTRVRLTHTGWPKSGLADEQSDWPATFEYFEHAWSVVFDALTEHFEPSGA